MKKKWLLQLLGIALFIYILFSVDIQMLLLQLQKVTIGWLIFSAIVLSGVYLLKSLRWKVLLHRLGIRYSYKNALLAFTSANLIAFVTPGRLGEVAKSVYVKNDVNQPISFTLPTVILDRIFDVYTLLFFAMYGILKYAIFKSFNVTTYIIIGLLIVLPVVMINHQFLKYLDTWMNKRKIFQPIQIYLQMFMNAIGRFNVMVIISSEAITLLAYGVLFIVAWAIGKSMGLDFTFMEYAMFISVANILSFLPISVAGLGTREASLVFLFAIFGVSSEVAVLYAMLIFVVFYVIGGLFGYICFILKPLDLKGLRLTKLK